MKKILNIRTIRYPLKEIPDMQELFVEEVTMEIQEEVFHLEKKPSDHKTLAIQMEQDMGMALDQTLDLEVANTAAATQPSKQLILIWGKVLQI